MIKLLSSILVIAFFLSLGCSRDDKPEAESTESSQELAGEVESETRDDEEYSDDNGEDDYFVSSAASLPELSEIKIQLVSYTPRDGFKAEPKSADPDNENINYSYEWKHNGELIIGGKEQVLQWQDEFKKGDALSVSVIPFDESGGSVWKAEGSFQIPNSPPEILTEPETTFEDGNFSYKVEAQDPDGDPFDFTLRNAPKGMTIEPATGLISWKYGPENAGEHSFKIVVTDSEGAYVFQELNFTIPSEQDPTGSAE